MPDTPLTTTAEVRAFREGAEAEILSILRKLCQLSQMDLDRVHVVTVVDANNARGEPQCIPYAVKIVLSA